MIVVHHHRRRVDAALLMQLETKASKMEQRLLAMRGQPSSVSSSTDADDTFPALPPVAQPPMAQPPTQPQPCYPMPKGTPPCGADGVFLVWCKHRVLTATHCTLLSTYHQTASCKCYVEQFIVWRITWSLATYIMHTFLWNTAKCDCQTRKSDNHHCESSKR